MEHIYSYPVRSLAVTCNLPESTYVLPMNIFVLPVSMIILQEEKRKFVGSAVVVILQPLCVSYCDFRLACLQFPSFINSQRVRDHGERSKHGACIIAVSVTNRCDQQKAFVVAFEQP